VAGIVAGVSAVALAAGIERSPLSPVLPPGAGPIAPLHMLARAAGLDAISPGHQAAFAITAVVGCTFAFLFSLREAWRGALSLRLVVGLGVAFVVVATVVPLLFSRDVYSYSIYGRIASVHHANPYVTVPADVSSDPLFRLVGPEWRHTPAVYGPAFTALSVGLTRLVGGVAALIWVFKLIAGAAAVATLLLVARTARRLRPERAAFAAALVGWNPVVLFHGVGGGHNDLLVGLALAGAFAIVAGRHGAGGAGGSPSVRAEAAARSAGRRELLATLVLTLGTLVKATGAVPLVLMVTAAVWRRPRPERLRAVAAHVGVVAAVAAVFAGPFFQTDDPTLGLATLATHQGWLAPTRFFRAVLGAVGHAAGGDVGRSVVETVVRSVFAAAFVGVFAVLVRETARRAARGSSIAPAGGGLGPLAQGAGWGWGLLLFTLLAPVLLPWYAVWVLPVVWTLPRVPRTGAIVLAGFLAVSQTVAEAVHFPGLFGAILLFGHYVLTPALFVVLVWLLVDMRRRVREGLPLEATPPPERERVPARADHR